MEIILRDGNKQRYVLVVEVEEKVCGVVVINLIYPIHETGAWCVTSALAIDEIYRGGGIGHKLFSEAERIAIDIGCTQTELSSNESRTKTHNFYQNNGYREVRKRFVKPVIAP